MKSLTRSLQPLETTHGSCACYLTHSRVFDATTWPQFSTLLPLLNYYLKSEPPAPEKFAFLDIETTGLGGGGALAFLIGVAKFEGGRVGGAVELKQFWMQQIGDERACLAAAGNYLADAEAIITYNGKSFDGPFLYERCGLNRMQPILAGKKHLDLLHLCRRFLRDKMPQLSLKDVEENLLKLRRTGDIPSAEIPMRYYEYIRTGDTKIAEPILYHNAVDILSMVAILHKLSLLLEDETWLGADGLYHLALMHEEKNAAESEKLLYRSLEAKPNVKLRTRIIETLTRLHRRSDQYDRAVALWQSAWEEFDLYSARQLAIHYERRERNFHKALHIVEETTRRYGLAYGKQRDEWKVRRERLLRKCSERGPIG